MRTKVAEVANIYIPGIQRRAKIFVTTRKITPLVFNIERLLRETRAALATSGETMIEAPGVLVGSQGRADFRRFASDCLAAARKLREQGAKDSFVLQKSASRRPSGQAQQMPNGPMKLGLQKSEALCKEASDSMEGLATRTTAHNKKYREFGAKKWEARHIKGPVMRRVYAENKKRQPRIENLAGSIIWTYRSYTTDHLTHECEDYEFSASGELKKRLTLLCN